MSREAAGATHRTRTLLVGLAGAVGLWLMDSFQILPYALLVIGLFALHFALRMPPEVDPGAPVFVGAERRGAGRPM
jgi:hypothetical protein